MDGIVAVREVAYSVLEHYSAGLAIPFTPDAGPAVLTALIETTDHPDDHHVVERVLATWLSECCGGTTSLGLCGGQAGLLVGVNAARGLKPRLVPLGRQLAQSLAQALAVQQRPAEMSWDYYDVISGAAGAVLALTMDPACPADLLYPGARLLARACDRDDLGGLRIGSYRGEELRGWNHGRINTGMAHGVTGVVAALRAACEFLGNPEELTVPLKRASQWLAAQVYRDDRGVLVWPLAAMESDLRPPGKSPLQAWCYGTPGVAWTLWDAGRVLSSDDLRVVASEAMASFCAAFDDEYFLCSSKGAAWDRLAFCHGAAGILMVADTFTRYANLAPARELRDRLLRRLLGMLSKIPEIAGQRMMLLNGATGILAALLTVQGGDRDWLVQYGLR
jgi:hypothetical protein